ncbi:MAG TPA: FadD3 family acyl-CoA ligase [Myxococcota bacterium]|nr:FadD3 family acyl-CoA ligase [Myxococcota bacterium]
MQGSDVKDERAGGGRARDAGDADARVPGAEERWERLTIPRTVARAAERFGERMALEDGDAHFSFRELAEAGVAAARACLAAGVERGDRVAIWAPNVAEWVAAAIGLQSAGAALVPLNTRFKGAEAGYVLRRSGARLLFTVGEFLGTDYVAALASEDLPALREIVTLRGRSAGATPWDEFLARGAAVPARAARERAAAVEPDDLSDVIFTSGTTGQPKGVMTTHGQNLRVFDAWSRGAGIREGDRYLIVNPFFHTFGYKAGWLACLQVGATAIPHAVFDASAVLERIGKERISVLPGPPTLYQSLLAHPERGRFDLSSLRLAVTGAAAIPVELVRRMRSELGFETVITAYGLTETSGTVTMCLPTDDAETIATTSGRALAGVEVKCADARGEEVPRGTAGEILVRGFNVMRGYFDDPAETAKTVDAQGWLHTGDVGVMDERGYLRITDRIKDMFIVGGFNCYPAEIENLMYRHDGIAQVAVVGVPDERMGEVGVAFVVPAPGASLAPDEVIRWCREHMANYKVPRRVELVDALPTNPSGKVLKYQLRQRAAH